MEYLLKTCGKFVNKSVDNLCITCGNVCGKIVENMLIYVNNILITCGKTVEFMRYGIENEYLLSKND